MTSESVTFLKYVSDGRNSDAMPAAEHLQETLTWIHNDTSLPTETTELWKKDHLSEGCLNRELPLARSRTSGPLYSHFRYISGHLQFA